MCKKQNRPEQIPRRGVQNCQNAVCLIRHTIKGMLISAAPLKRSFFVLMELWHSAPGLPDAGLILKKLPPVGKRKINQAFFEGERKRKKPGKREQRKRKRKRKRKRRRMWIRVWNRTGKCKCGRSKNRGTETEAMQENRGISGSKAESMKTRESRNMETEEKE